MRAVAVGRFDGVHVGHQALLAAGRRFAQARGLRLMAFTFPPYRPALLPLAAREKLLRALADEVYVCPWEDVRHLDAEAFLRDVVVDQLDGVGLIVGHDHRFGAGRGGDLALVRRLSGPLGLEVVPVPPVHHGGSPVSARRIRALVQRGAVADAAVLLGRPVMLFGDPVRGAGLAHRLGYPTVNLALWPGTVAPAPGVYAAHAYRDRHAHRALFYIGDRPTFPGLGASAEVHFLDAPPAGSGSVEVHLWSRLRPDRAFPSSEALVEQMGQDRREAEALLTARMPETPVLLG